MYIQRTCKFRNLKVNEINPPKSVNIYIMMLHENDKLKQLRVYQIEFYRTPYDVAHDYNTMSIVEKEKLSSLEIFSSFDYEDDFNNYILIFITDKTTADKYKIILFNNVIPNVTKDLSDNIINGKIDLLEDLQKFRNSKNTEKYFDFMVAFESWLEANLDLDKILDIINEKGLEALKEIHLRILKKI